MKIRAIYATEKAASALKLLFFKEKPFHKLKITTSHHFSDCPNAVTWQVIGFTDDL